MSDIDRFMRSLEGRARLDDIRRSLVGRRIAALDFINAAHSIIVEFSLDDGECHAFEIPELDIDTIRRDYESVLEREYNKDYPDRNEG